MPTRIYRATLPITTDQNGDYFEIPDGAIIRSWEFNDDNTVTVLYSTTIS